MAGRKGKLLVLLFSAMIIFGMSGSSSAAVYSITENAGGEKLWLLNSYGWDVDIVGLGFNPATSDVLSGTLALYLRDDGDSIGEDGQLTVSTAHQNEAFIGNPTSYVLLTLSSNAISWLQDGNTHFHLYATAGDFYFDRAVFTATTSDPVPEPGTMLLLGSGLVGLASFGRKKFRK